MGGGPEEKLVQRYRKAGQVLDWMFVGLVLFLLAVRVGRLSCSLLGYSILLLPFLAASGWRALLHRKLPKQKQEKANWLSGSSFNIHPYITFLVFLVLEGIFLLGSWTGAAS